MTVRLSIVVATLNRPTLPRTLASFVEAGIGADDEVLVVWGDASDPSEAVASAPLPCPVRVLYARAAQPDYGNTQRTTGLRAATGTHIAFMDDDDVYNPAALSAIRAAVQLERKLPHLFRVTLSTQNRFTVWADKRIRYGNVSTLGIIVPNEPKKLPSWPVRTANGTLTPWGGGGNDTLFALACERAWGKFVFRPEIVATARP